MDKPEPKYKIEQIVVIRTIKNQLPFRIKDIMWNDDWFYQYNKNNWFSEGMLRELTPVEKGGIIK